MDKSASISRQASNVGKNLRKKIGDSAFLNKIKNSDTMKNTQD